MTNFPPEYCPSNGYHDRIHTSTKNEAGGSLFKLKYSVQIVAKEKKPNFGRVVEARSVSINVVPYRARTTEDHQSKSGFTMSLFPRYSPVHLPIPPSQNPRIYLGRTISEYKFRVDIGTGTAT